MRIKGSLVMIAGMLFAMPLTAGAEEGVWEGWDGSVFAGYSQSNGNTDKSAGNAQFEAAKKSGRYAYLFKSTMTYSETNDSMDGQKWDALGRFSFDYGKNNKWYSFYQVLVDHDYFADIDYRITPSAGLGYHIADSEDWKWDADAGLGYRIERHRVNTAADDEYLTALAHTFMKKRVFDKAYLSEDVTVYPGLKTDAATTVRSETTFTNPLTETTDMELKYIVDYNTEPAAGKKKTDTQFIAGLKYKF